MLGLVKDYLAIARGSTAVTASHAVRSGRSAIGAIAGWRPPVGRGLAALGALSTGASQTLAQLPCPVRAVGDGIGSRSGGAARSDLT